MSKRKLFITSAAIFLYAISSSAQIVNRGEVFSEKGTALSFLSNFTNSPAGTFVNNGELFVYGDWDNNGVVDYLDSNGLTVFGGSREQSISGESVSYFSNVTFQNYSTDIPFLLSGNISVGGECYFESGVVDNKNFGGNFVFGQNGNQFSTSNSSYVNGAVEKVGNQSFVFPVGDDGLYRSLEISAPDTSVDAFKAQYFFENPDAQYPVRMRSGDIDELHDREYWVVSREFGSSGVLLTLSWGDGLVSSPALEIPDQIQIAKWDDDIGYWIAIGGVVDEVNKTVTTPVAIEKFGVFTFAKVEGLPGNVFVFNAISANDDGKNDYLILNNIENYPNNTLEVFNRWGVKVFATNNYGTSGNFFRGRSEGSIPTLVGSGEYLPTGTYYYVLSYDYENQDGTNVERITKAGYVYLVSE